MLAGIDTSSHQGAVDWARVAGDGVGFAFAKASGGQWYRNPYFADQWRGARAAGLIRGAYHFAFESSGAPGGDPIAEAEYFCDTVGRLEPGDLVALDVEDGDGNLGQWALAWLARVEERLGVRPFVYTGAWFSDEHGFPETPELGAYPLWLAAYQPTMPEPVRPWSAVTIWQHADDGLVAGVSTPVDLNQFDGTRDELLAYGLAEGEGTVTPPPTEPLPAYDPSFPAFAQNDDWSCAPTSTRWALWAYGRQPSEEWLESSMLQAGVVTTEYGLMDASGAGLADWLNTEYGGPDYGYEATNDPSVGWLEVAAEARQARHPLVMGGRGWYHWTGVRGFDGTRLLLANPAPGWCGVTQNMSLEQFRYLGPFSLVRLVHPASEGQPVVPKPPSGDPYGPWRATIGSGLLELMAQDGTLPAVRASTWLPLGAPSPHDIEEAVGQNGLVYRWLLTVGQGFRYAPM